jgi:hypothetical protein
LGLAGKRGLVNLGQAFELIKKTSFRYPQSIMDEFLGEEPDAPGEK